MSFSVDTAEARRQWDDVLKVPKTVQKLSTQNLYPVKLSFKNENEINIFSVRNERICC